MALTITNKFLLSVLTHRNLKILNAVKKEWFDTAELRGLTFVKKYYSDHGELPPVDVYASKFSITDKVKGRPAYFLRELKNRYIATSLTDIIPGIMAKLSDDPEKGLETLLAEIRELKTDTYTSKDVRLSDNAIERFKNYEERVATKGVVDLSTGEPVLDETMYGYRKADLITIGGAPGVGKTWLLIYLFLKLKEHLENSDEHKDSKILFITNEMPEEEIIERIDCVEGKLPYEDFMKGELSPRNRRRYKKLLEKMQREGSNVIIVYNVSTVDELNVLIDLYSPLAVFLDGSYIMEGDEGGSVWERTMSITRALKKTAKVKHTPIINTTQLTRGSGKKASKKTTDGQDEFAYTNSYSQDSDISYRLYQTADMVFHSEIGMETVKGRRVKPNTRYIFTLDLVGMNQSICLEEEETKTAVTW